MINTNLQIASRPVVQIASLPIRIIARPERPAVLVELVREDKLIDVAIGANSRSVVCGCVWIYQTTSRHRPRNLASLVVVSVLAMVVDRPR